MTVKYKIFFFKQKKDMNSQPLTSNYIQFYSYNFQKASKKLRPILGFCFEKNLDKQYLPLYLTCYRGSCTSGCRAVGWWGVKGHNRPHPPPTTPRILLIAKQKLLRKILNDPNPCKFFKGSMEFNKNFPHRSYYCTDQKN